MEIAFADRTLRAVCEDGAVAELDPDADISDLLRDRLADLRAADSVLDCPGLEILIVQDPEPAVQITLARGFALLAKPNHRQPPRAQDGSVDWRRVRRIQITEVARP
jgi:hypothetical protein